MADQEASGAGSAPEEEAGPRLAALRRELAEARDGETRVRCLLEAARGGVWVVDADGVTSYANRHLAESLGYGPEEMLARPLLDFLPPEERRFAEEVLHPAAAERGVRRDVALLRRDGSRAWALVEAAPLRDGWPSDGALLWVTDISGRRRAERALWRRARLEAATADLGHRALLGTPAEELLREASALLVRALEVERSAVWELLPGEEALRLRSGTGWEEGVEGEAVVAAGAGSHPGFVLASGQTVVIENLLAEDRFSTFLLRQSRVLAGMGTPLWRPHGAWGVLAVYSTRHRMFEPEEIDFLTGVAAVLAAGLERERTRAELEETRERFELLGRATGDAIWDRDLRTGAAWFSPAFHALLGHDPRQVEATVELWASALDEEDRERVLAGLEAAVAGTAGSWSDEYRLRTAAGGRVDVYDRAAILRDAEGHAVRLIGAMTDATERRRREEADLRLRDLDALGRLAGGVAHDLDNRLATILGFTELLLAGLAADDPRRADLMEIRSAAERSAVLIRRLLAIGGRPLLSPQPLDPNVVVAGLEPRLRAEAGDGVRLVTILGPGAWTVASDPWRLEEALLELVTNARQAMPGGGELTVETANVTLHEPFATRHGLRPGDHVMLAVADTGQGMDAATRSRAFEPFFTTRPQGTAQGLGLAAVYGMARQSGGGVSLHSEPGLGTTVKVYLPRRRPEGSGTGD